MRASADGVLFEFGPSPNQDLAWRSKIREWQPQLRLLFLAEIALWKYRARVTGFELPESVRVAQRAFDDELARKLAELADRLLAKHVLTATSQGDLEIAQPVGLWEGQTVGIQFLSLFRATESSEQQVA